MAFANAFLGVCHSMAHKLGAFHHLPHGVANAVILTDVIRYNAADDPPSGGLAYYKKLMRQRKVLYKGIFFPLVKASLGNDTAQTKGDSITFGTSATTFNVFRCNSDDWRITEEFQTEAECVAWCDEKLTPTTPAA